MRDRIKSLKAIGIVTSRGSGKRHRYTLKICIEEKRNAHKQETGDPLIKEK